MKRILYIFLSFSLILFSCHKDPIPTASFSADNSSPEVGQTVFFSNTSLNGDSFTWDFNDGTTSNDVNPTHVFTATGPYNVVLTATTKGQQSQASMTINVQVPTLLLIEVREYYSDDLIPNASILLYPTLADWDNQTNSVMEAFTDQNGVAVFSNLDAFVYYVDVWEQNHDNYTLRNEDVGWIRTPEVLPNSITTFLAYVDVATHTSGRNHQSFTIKKLERKSVERNLIPAYLSRDWQKYFRAK